MWLVAASAIGVFFARVSSLIGRIWGQRHRKALVTLRASQGGFGVFRNHGPRGLSDPAGGEETFEIALSPRPFVWCVLPSHGLAL
jgi:hypothetical protein